MQWSVASWPLVAFTAEYAPISAVVDQQNFAFNCPLATGDWRFPLLIVSCTFPQRKYQGRSTAMACFIRDFSFPTDFQTNFLMLLRWIHFLAGGSAGVQL
jgi:hypothetical protein